jgi:hypothetical protein
MGGEATIRLFAPTELEGSVDPDFRLQEVSESAPAGKDI